MLTKDSFKYVTKDSFIEYVQFTQNHCKIAFYKRSEQNSSMETNPRHINTDIKSFNKLSLIYIYLKIRSKYASVPVHTNTVSFLLQFHQDFANKKNMGTSES